jgi:hypothetical protein
MVPNGVVARDFFTGGLCEALHASGMRVIVLTPDPDVLVPLVPAHQVDEWIRTPAGAPRPLVRRIARVRHRAPRPGARALWALEGRLSTRSEAAEALRRLRPDVLVVPTPRYGDVDVPYARAARGLGIPLVCAVSSWDNLHKGQLESRGDLLCVWGPALAERARTAHGYPARRIRIVGSLQLNPYHAVTPPPRRETVLRLGLDPARPLVVVATIGVLRLGLDERYLVDAVRRALPECQVVFRVHPDELERYAHAFAGDPAVRVHHGAQLLASVVLRHRWFMGPLEYAETAALLVAADVLVSLGTTLHLEAALLGTPSIIAGFQPAAAPAIASFLSWVRMRSHLSPILDRRLLPYAASEADLADELHPLGHGAPLGTPGREALLEEFVGPADGRAAARLAAVVRHTAERHRAA